jgi:hypothetical protein
MVIKPVGQVVKMLKEGLPDRKDHGLRDVFKQHTPQIYQQRNRSI